MDYVVIAINPAIIMVLIGSLVYFLLELFYQGQYPARLHYCLTLFIVGIVLIGRISIEEGWERASIFAAAMAIVISIAMQRFVSYKGTNLEQWGWLVNYFLIALSWWCAHKLTWDCTLVDDSQDASGQGLLQTAGLDADGAEDGQAGGQNRAGGASPGRVYDARLAKAATDDSILPPDRNSALEKTWWDRFIERRRRPHAPGVWVVYFSLAALPMFGVGQAFIPESNESSRRYAFILLAIYVTAALALLLTTSFLGLRKYLRQRRMEMPVAMASVWLATGAVMIVGLLVVAAILPRPNAEYDLTQLPLGVKSEDQESSKLAAGKEGTSDKEAESAPGEKSRPDKQQTPDEQNGNKASDGNDPNLKPRDDTAGRPNPNAKPGEAKSGDGNSGKAKSGDGQSGKSDAGKSGSDASKSDQAKPANNSSKPRDADKPKDGGSAATPSEKPAQPKPGGQTSGRPKTPELPPLPYHLVYSWTVQLLKLVVYAIIGGIVLWFLIFHWQTALDWLQSLLNGWRTFWQRLFGRPADERQAAVAAARRRSFADYSDPFAAGIAGRFTPADLVSYTFEAFEAWAGDNGCPREPDETVHDFAKRIGGEVDSLATPGRKLAELYSWAAYSPRTLSAAAEEPVREFWQALLKAEAEQVAGAAT